MVSEQFIFYGIIIFMWMETIWDFYLSLRQRRIYKNAVEVPSELKEIVTKETFDKARIYGLDRNNFSMVKEVIGGITTTSLLMMDGLFYFWVLGGSLVSSMNLENGEIVQSAAFILVMNTFNFVMSIPFNIYDVFILEEKHGFNKQTIGFFIKDKIKGYIVTHLIVLPLTCGIVWIVKVGGDYFFIYLWLFAILATLFLLTIYPDYIAPLFDKYTPLPDGELKTRIEQLAASIHFPLYKLYVVEGSKRSIHSNAYFYGFFKSKRIVLFDTLLKDYTPTNAQAKENKEETKEEEKKGCDNEEVLAVLGHELGHWKLNHMIKNIIIMQVNMFLLFVAFGFLFKYKVLYNAFGFYNEQPVLIGLTVVLQFIFSPYHAFLNFLTTSLSRRFEFQADAFAKSMGKAMYLRRALIKLNQDNLGFPVYDWLFSMWHHSHPPLLERLKALEKSE